MHVSSKWFLTPNFSDKHCVYILISSIYAASPDYPILLDIIILIVYDEEYQLWSSKLCSIL
jgi:hypothetical protein